jgi:alginate O-acetyltransferase complex protein AlgI
MVFSSIVFLFLFLPPVLAGYYLLHAFAPRFWKHLFLTLCSYVFYGWSNPWFIWLMLVSTAIDYVCARLMTDGFRSSRAAVLPLLEIGGARTRGQRAALVASMVSNLALLGFFKYFNFGIDSWNALAMALGAEGLALDTTLRVVLPLGISFYTFQSMSYTIDVYRGDGRAIRSFPDFACYVSMFPQLVAGPIIRFQEVADQIADRTHTVEKFARGVAFVCFGMAKKILLADTCGQIADFCFDAQQLSASEAWTGALAYAFQIYYDFSGYSDMAIGFGLMIGFMFAKNFDSPYRSASIGEFWRRWHLSLSNWLRDYLYIPLGGNRRGNRRTYANLIVVMLLGGLWHGASWNFVVWGGLHGAALVLERAWNPSPARTRFGRFLRIAATFAFVLFTWVPFRAPDLASTRRYWGAMLGLGSPDGATGLVSGATGNPYLMGSLAVAAAVAFLGVQSWDFTRRLTPIRAALAMALFVVSLGMLVATSFHPFIYFIF